MKRSPMPERKTELKRTQLKRTQSNLKKTKLKQRSAKKQKQMSAAQIQVERLIKERGNKCEVCPKIRTVDSSWNFCFRTVGGRHHLRKQNAKGSDSDDNILLACNPGNLWVEDNPDLAYQAGLVVREGDADWERFGPDGNK